MKLNIKALMITRAFYNVELGREDLTERERDKYLKAKKIIEKIIGEKEKAGENLEGYYIENKEETKRYQRRYRIKNQEKIKRYQRRYRVKNRERIRECQKQQLVQL